MITRLPRLFGILAMLAVTAKVAAQVPGGPPGMTTILARVLESSPPFSALADVRMLSLNEAESMHMPMEFKFLEGNIRTEINMAQVQTPALRQDMVVNLREIGMDQVVTIGRAGRAPMLVLYPHIKACIEIAPPGAPPDPASRTTDPPPQSLPLPSPAAKPPRKLPLEKETVDGHPCQKVKVWIEDPAGGKPQEVEVWEAQDLKGFPVQIQMTQPEFRLVVLFRDLRFDRPDAKDFQAPPEFTKFPSMEKVMEKAVNKLLGDPAPKK